MAFAVQPLPWLAVLPESPKKPHVEKYKEYALISARKNTAFRGGRGVLQGLYPKCIGRQDAHQGQVSGNIKSGMNHPHEKPEEILHMSE